MHTKAFRPRAISGVISVAILCLDALAPKVCYCVALVCFAVSVHWCWWVRITQLIALIFFYYFFIIFIN